MKKKIHFMKYFFNIFVESNTPLRILVHENHV